MSNPARRDREEGHTGFGEKATTLEQAEKPREKSAVVRVREGGLFHGAEGTLTEDLRGKIGHVPHHDIVQTVAAPLAQITVHRGPWTAFKHLPDEPVL
jgi:hypothetical protein